MEQSKKEWLDDLLDNTTKPIIDEKPSFGYLGFMESLINSSINTDEFKDHLIDSLDDMPKDELDALMVHLKDNQTHRDCKEQYKEMCKKGVFKQNNKI